MMPGSGRAPSRVDIDLQNLPLNKIIPLLNFMRFFKTLRYFVASIFSARL